MEFYENGMTGVNPDSPLIKIDDGKIEVEITYEPSDVFKGFQYELYYEQGNSFTKQEKACWINKEKIRAVFICHAKYKGNYELRIFGGPVDKEDYPLLFKYDIHSTKNVPDLLDFPSVSEYFFNSDIQVIEPLYAPLPRGEFVNFKVRTTTYDNIYIRSGNSRTELENDGNGLFTGEAYIAGKMANITTKIGNKFWPIAKYSTKLSPNVDVEPTYPTSYLAQSNVLYSPLLNPLKIGKLYDFKIKCKKCKKLAVLDDTYRYLIKNGDMYTGTVNITGKGKDKKVWIIDEKNGHISYYYEYDTSY